MGKHSLHTKALHEIAVTEQTTESLWFLFSYKEAVFTIFLIEYPWYAMEGILKQWQRSAHMYCRFAVRTPFYIVYIQTSYTCMLSCIHSFYVWFKVRGYLPEILLGQWHPVGATPHHAKPILCLWLEIRALNKVLLASMQPEFQSPSLFKNGHWCCSYCHRETAASVRSWIFKLRLGSRGGPHVKKLSSFFSHDWSNRYFR